MTQHYFNQGRGASAFSKLPFFPKKLYALIIAMLLINGVAMSKVFTAVASGNWSNAVTWGATPPSFTTNIDQIIIPSGIVVNMDNNVNLNGTQSVITVEGTLTSGPSTTLTVNSGSIVGGGTIIISNVIFGAGAVFGFTGNFTAKILYSSILNLQTAAKITISQMLYLSAGVLSLQNNGTFSIGNNATIVFAGGRLLNNGGVFILTPVYNVTYSSGSLTAGPELGGSGLKDLNIDVSTGNTVTLSGDVTVNGILTLNSGILSLGSKNLNITGDVAATGTGTIKSTSASGITINSPSGITGALNFEGTLNAVNNLTLNVGSVNNAQISGTLTVEGTLALTSGTLKLSSSNLIIAGDIAPTGTGKVSSSSSSNITVSSNASLTGALNFVSGNNTVNNFSVKIGGGGSVHIASDLNVNGILDFTGGRLDIGSNKLIMGSTASITGAGATSYIVTSDSGKVSMVLASAVPATFPVGTSGSYFPAIVMLNPGSDVGRIDVGVNNNVLALGTTGIDISASRHLVDATWYVSADFTANMNMSLNVLWPAGAEVNGFVRTAAYISHYTNANWDTVAASSAILAGSGMYSTIRSNITSLSPFAVFEHSAVTPTAINIDIIETSVTLYPNPAAETIHVTNIAAPVNITIFNMKGEVMRSDVLDKNNRDINISGLSKGYYYIQLRNEKMNVTKKFVKM